MEILSTSTHGDNDTYANVQNLTDVSIDSGEAISRLRVLSSP